MDNANLLQDRRSKAEIHEERTLFPHIIQVSHEFQAVKVIYISALLQRANRNADCSDITHSLNRLFAQMISQQSCQLVFRFDHL